MSASSMLTPTSNSASLHHQPARTRNTSTTGWWNRRPRQPTNNRRGSCGTGLTRPSGRLHRPLKSQVGHHEGLDPCSTGRRTSGGVTGWRGWCLHRWVGEGRAKGRTTGHAEDEVRGGGGGGGGGVVDTDWWRQRQGRWVAQPGNADGSSSGGGCLPGRSRGKGRRRKDGRRRRLHVHLCVQVALAGRSC